ncbi:MAG: Metallo-beta-lactamase superfamily protein [Actinomycetia bacterium]|nr:Metallo-beta-lactamase superfamily protein [Actinomycetes bacterium]
MELHPRLLIHGHAGLTAAYTIEAFPGLLAAFRDLDDAVRAGITDGLTLVEP